MTKKRKRVRRQRDDHVSPSRCHSEFISRSLSAILGYHRFNAVFILRYDIMYLL